MTENLYKLVFGTKVGLAILPVALFISCHFGLVSPDSEKSLQERAKLAQQVLAPIEYCLKQRSKNRRKRLKHDRIA
jgi:hypothetical protein